MKSTARDEVKRVGFLERFRHNIRSVLYGPSNGRATWRRPGRILTLQQSGDLGLLSAPRTCDLFDLPEFTPAQKCATVMTSLSVEATKKIRDLFGPTFLHSVTQETTNLRRLGPELRVAILCEFADSVFPRSPERVQMPSLKAMQDTLDHLALHCTVQIGNALHSMLQSPHNMPHSDSFDEVFYYQDLVHHHKSAAIFWLTNSLEEANRRIFLEDGPRAFLSKASLVLPRLSLMTKLRVIREFLDIPLTKRPSPNPDEEFSRLVLALNVICREDPELFAETVKKKWPEMMANPLLVKALKNTLGRA